MDRLQQLATQYCDGLLTRDEYKNATIAQLCIRSDDDWDKIAVIFTTTYQKELTMPQGGGD